MNNPKIDLHGVRHKDVDLIVENFIYENQNKTPLIIICGNSAAMINEVELVLKRIKCSYDQSRYGIIRVLDI